MKEHNHQLKTERTDYYFFLRISLHGQLLYSAQLFFWATKISLLVLLATVHEEQILGFGHWLFLLSRQL